MDSGRPGPFWQKTKCISAGLVFSAIAFLCNETCAEAQSHAGFPHAERARALMEARQNPEAIEEWGVALKAEPENPVYRNLYGLALQSVGRTADARKQFQQAIQLSSDFVDAHSNLAYNFWTDGDENAAILEFDRALKLRPADPALHLARGLLAASGEKGGEACKQLDRARPWPNDPETLWRIFSAYQVCRQPKEAVEAVSLLPADNETQLNIGKTLLAFHQPQFAIPFLERSQASGSQASVSILLLAEAHLSSGQPEKALQETSLLPESERTSTAALELRASCLLKMGKRSEAQEQFAALVERFPENPEAYVDATQIPLEDQNWETSLDILNRGLQKIPGSWLLLFRRAMTFKLSGHSPEALSDLLEAMRRDGDIPLLAAALGEVYASQANLAGAAQMFHRTFDETGAPEFQFAYALALEREGNDAGALKEMKKAAALLPSDARAHFEYGKLLRQNGEIKAARQELERAKALAPDLSSNLYVLTRLYQSLGETDRAARTLKEFLASKQKSGANQQ